MNSTSIIDWLMRTSVEASVLIVGIWLMRRLLGTRLTPGWRIALWAVVGIKLLLPLSLSSLPGLASLWPRQEAPAYAAAVSRTAAQPVPTDVTTRHTAHSETTHTLTANQWLMGVWLLGGTLVLGIAVARHTSFRRQLSRLPVCADAAMRAKVHRISQSMGLRQVPEIRVSAPRSVPAVTGLLRPTLLLPADWRTALSEGALDEVLKHELSHVKHHDLWWNWASLLVAALHWFNPLVWKAVTEFHEDRELRCDASALTACSARQRVAYGRILLRYQQSLIAPVATAGVAPLVRTPHSLHQRLLMITHPLATRPWLHLVAAVSLGLFVCAAFGAERPEDTSKSRMREGERSGGSRAPGQREGSSAEGSGEMSRPKGSAAEGKREGGRSAEGQRDGGRPAAEGAKDGERGREGARGRDGERGRDGTAPKEGGMRDGERTRTGPRDGERSREGGERDGKTSESTGSLVLRVVDGGESVLVGKDKVPMNRLRSHLSKVLPEQPGVQVSIEADDDVPFKTVGQVLDAARDNGAKRAQIQSGSNPSKGEG